MRQSDLFNLRVTTQDTLSLANRSLCTMNLYKKFEQRIFYCNLLHIRCQYD